jgi:hypothetical protein
MKKRPKAQGVTSFLNLTLMKNVFFERNEKDYKG